MHRESMPIGTLQLRIPYFYKKLRSSADSQSGPSTSGYEASAVSAEGDLRATMGELLPAEFGGLPSGELNILIQGSGRG